jgi:uncharacterized membrane protein YidH (DUF202 family)
MQVTEQTRNGVTAERTMLIWGAVLFGVGAVIVLLFFERVVQWPLGWPFYHETGIVIGALLASLGHALLVAGLVQRGR